MKVFVHFKDTNTNASKDFKAGCIPHIGEKISFSDNGEIYVVDDVLYNNFPCQYQIEIYVSESTVPEL